MLSPCRTSVSSFPSLVRAVKSQQAFASQARPGQSSYHSSSPSTSSASTSRSSLPRSSRTFSSSVKVTAERRARSIQTDSPSPAYNIPITPKAAKTVDQAQAWLQEAFPGLSFPDDVAMMMITHESWDHGTSSGHNRRLAFLGRRALKFYLSLFMSTNSSSAAMMSTEKINDLLHTSKLGESVGRHLKLGEIMRWTPAVNDGQRGPKEAGLYKIRGVTVEALLGAIYHQHGAQIARSFFSSRILPFLGTFSEQEAETLKGAIDNEAREGESLLRRLGKASPASSIEGLARGEAQTGALDDLSLADVEEPSKESTGPRSLSSISTGVRRRTVSSSTKGGLPLEDEPSNANPSSDRRSVA